jgi:hypothetical protein
MCHIPIEIFCAPFRVEPFLVQILWGVWSGDISMWGDSFLEVLPHVNDNAFMVPPVDISFFCFF